MKMNILLVNLIFMIPKKEDVFLLIRAPKNSKGR